MSELKPCPFCGGEAEAEIIVGTGVMVSCKTFDCAFIVKQDSPFLDEAITAWNKRPLEEKGNE